MLYKEKTLYFLRSTQNQNKHWMAQRRNIKWYSGITPSDLWDLDGEISVIQNGKFMLYREKL